MSGLERQKMCKYNRARRCDGLCNNCPTEYYKGIEEEKAAGTYVPTFAPATRFPALDDNDYEGAILAAQEAYLDF